MKYQRHLVVHNYTDHANSVCKDEDSSSASDWTNHRRQNAGGVKEPFPLKLHRMLQSEEEEEEEENENHPTSGTCSSVVRWMPHGRAFIVLNPAEFVRTTMPKYFKQTKWTSFQRQLNLYGFNRLTKGADAGAYYHELFLRGDRYLGLCQSIVRVKVKGTGIKGANNPADEPDFYSMPFIKEIDESSFSSSTAVSSSQPSMAVEQSIIANAAPVSSSGVTLNQSNACYTKDIAAKTASNSQSPLQLMTYTSHLSTAMPTKIIPRAVEVTPILSAVNSTTMPITTKDRLTAPFNNDLHRETERFTGQSSAISPLILPASAISSKRIIWNGINRTVKPPTCVDYWTQFAKSITDDQAKLHNSGKVLVEVSDDDHSDEEWKTEYDFHFDPLFELQ